MENIHRLYHLIPYSLSVPRSRTAIDVRSWTPIRKETWSRIPTGVTGSTTGW